MAKENMHTLYAKKGNTRGDILLYSDRKCTKLWGRYPRFFPNAPTLESKTVFAQFVLHRLVWVE